MLDLNPVDDLPTEELPVDPMYENGKSKHDVQSGGQSANSNLAAIAMTGAMILILWGAVEVLR